MDTMIHAVINRKVYPLHYSIEVMFDVNEKYGSIQNALEILERDGRDSFDALRFLAVAMQNDAELCRRAEGYDNAPMLEEKDISLRMNPAAYLALKMAVSQAVSAGYKQEKKTEDEEVDLGLLELSKKEEAGK